MQTTASERYQVEVMFHDEEHGWDDVWAATTKTYATRQLAERAAINLEIRNAQNGAGCKTRVIAYPVSK